MGWKPLLTAALMVLTAACGGKDAYPDLSEVPDRPAPNLTPERSEEMADELRAAREEAVRHATEGRPAQTDGSANDVVDESGSDEDRETAEDDTE